MELIRSLSQLRPRHRGCVATIGNFDGVHQGHRMIFDLLREKGRALGLPVAVVLFEPQPQEFFKGSEAPPRLTRLREKLLAMQALDIERVLCLRFDHALVNMPPKRFIEAILVDGLQVRYLIVGDDFRFGRQRRGNFQTLEKAGRHHGFEVIDTPTYTLEEERVSSTRIRNALKRGDMGNAAHLLGRPYSLCGRVAHGDKLGRTIGFPTANIHLHRHASPVSGVFAVHVKGLSKLPWPGVANLGMRPTVNGTRLLLEVHLFHFGDDIYGRYVEVEFVARLREERRFPNFEALREQIEQDARDARRLLGC